MRELNRPLLIGIIGFLAFLTSPCMAGYDAATIEAPSAASFNGAFVGDAPSVYQIRNYERKTGTVLESVLFFHAAKKGFEFPKEVCQVVASENKVPFIKFEPWSWKGKSDYTFGLDKISRGIYDADYFNFAKGAAEFGKPLYFSFAHEMNASIGWRWYPWQGDPEKYKDAYIRVHNIFKEAGAKNVRWVWVINARTAYPEQYYPGDDFVDWIGMDGYSANWNSNPRDPAVIFENDYKMLHELHPNKPIMIAETGYDENNGGSADGKKEYIKNLTAYCAKRNLPFYYFDTDKLEGDTYRKWGLKEDYYKVLGRGIIDNHISTAYEAKGTLSGADEAAIFEQKGIPLASMIKANNVFNGANGEIKEEYDGTTIDFVSEGCNDPGIALVLNDQISGELAFYCQGSISGGYRNGAFTALFIKTLSYGEKILKEEDLDPTYKGINVLAIPQGTNKINFMIVGPNSVGRIKLFNVKVI